MVKPILADYGYKDDKSIFNMEQYITDIYHYVDYLHIRNHELIRVIKVQKDIISKHDRLALVCNQVIKKYDNKFTKKG